MTKKKWKFFFIVFFFFSCNGYKNIPYYQDLKDSKYAEEKINNYSVLKIQPGDIIGVNVNGVNQEAASVFNTNIMRVNGNNLDNTK
jgi:polysaccharide export outer membrane protein